MEITTLLIVIFVLLVGLALVVVILKNRDGVVEEILPYKRKKYFFSRSEQQFLNILEQKLDHSKYSVFPKVRLGDFIEVDLPKGQRLPYWNKIKSKHVDFLIYNYQTATVALAIELDGNSHNHIATKKSDSFKDKLYPAVGLELVRVRVGTDFAAEVDGIVSRIT